MLSSLVLGNSLRRHSEFGSVQAPNRYSDATKNNKKKKKANKQADIVKFCKWDVHVWLYTLKENYRIKLIIPFESQKFIKSKIFFRNQKQWLWSSVQKMSRIMTIKVVQLNKSKHENSKKMTK